MKPLSEDDVRRIVSHEISKILTNFHCPKCEHETLARELLYSHFDRVYCYTCGHIFTRSESQWVDGGEFSRVWK